ncbi:nucleotide synthetase [Brevundimonas sp.]|uniref:nucleotide synthetase n=1 Tax=Brevundimonas sp. TaxID=1871086 RepID=UPI002FC6163F
MNGFEEDQSPPETGLRLATKMDASWKAIEIIYTRYTRDPADPTKVISSPGSYVVCPGNEPQAGLRKFLNSRLNDEKLPPPVCTRKKHCKDPLKTKPLPVDIYVGVPSYIVIELDKDTGWTFRKNHPGITAAANYGNANGALRHVRRNVPDDGPNGPTSDDCRIIYFSATQREEFEHQKFHCHINFGSLAADPVAIDPDIPNDGGKFPIHDASPCNGGRCGYPECDGVEET